MNKRIITCLCLALVSFFSLSSCSNKTSCVIDDRKEVVTINYSSDKTYSSLADMIEEIKPSVVDIYSYGSSFVSAGSGVIVGKGESSYYVITNHHVIDNALSFDVVVYFNDDSNITYEASLIGGSPKNDIAVLQINSDKELKVASVVEDSSLVRVGEEVIAIGNPLGILGGSVTHGIISAKEREVYVDSIGYMSLFQTDAAINSGNSGGALFNSNGLLIGIVNSGYSNYEGLNFAIPWNKARDCFTSIVNTYHESGNNLGYMKGESNIGINLSSATIYSSSALTSQSDVIYVNSIDEDSDSSNKGIKDLASFSEGKYTTFYALTKINDQEVKSLEEAQRTLAKLEAGEKVKLTFKEISYARTGGFFGQNIYYLTDNTVNIEIELSQYIYSL